MILSLHNLPDLVSRTKLLDENPFDIIDCMRDVKNDAAVILEDSAINKHLWMILSPHAVIYVFLVLTAEVYLVELSSQMM